MTYNTDGYPHLSDDAKGQGSGTWSAVEGELCQASAGKPTQCGQFKSTAMPNYAGSMRLCTARATAPPPGPKATTAACVSTLNCRSVMRTLRAASWYCPPPH